MNRVMINKRLYIILLGVVISTGLFARAPGNFKYQAVVRNASGEVMKNQPVSLRLSVLQGNQSGDVVFSETHNCITNAFGLVNLNIGENNQAVFDTINWSRGPYYIKIEMGGDVMGVNQLLSVPYAKYADAAGNVFDGNYQSLSNKPAIEDTISAFLDTTSLFIRNETDHDTTNEIQTISRTGLVVTLSRGGGSYNDSIFSGNMNNQNITNLADPVNEQDAATKAYVDHLEQNVSLLEDIIIKAGLYTIEDVDGNIYNVIKINDQLWMAENLKTTKYNNGTPIAGITDPDVWSGTSQGAYCWYDGDSALYDSLYGKLYNAHAANNGNLCPDGWHVPSNAEWNSLFDNIGGTGVAGGKLKEEGTVHWDSPNTDATDEFGFTALPGGYRNNSGTFSGQGTGGYFWTSTEFSTNNYYYRRMLNSTAAVSNFAYNVNYGISVRCIKD